MYLTCQSYAVSFFLLITHGIRRVGLFIVCSYYKDFELVKYYALHDAQLSETVVLHSKMQTQNNYSIFMPKTSNYIKIIQKIFAL